MIALETLHAIIGFTVGEGTVHNRSRDRPSRRRARHGAGSPAQSRSRRGHQNIHSLSAYAIEDVKLGPGTERAVGVEIAMSNSAGIFQVDELLAEKLRGSGLEEHVEVIARIDGEHEQRLISGIQTLNAWSPRHTATELPLWLVVARRWCSRLCCGVATATHGRRTGDQRSPTATSRDLACNCLLLPTSGGGAADLGSMHDAKLDSAQVGIAPRLLRGVRADRRVRRT